MGPVLPHGPRKVRNARSRWVADQDNLAGRLSSNLDWQISARTQLLNTLKYFPSLEDADDLYGSFDTRLRLKINASMFGQLQWVIDYDNTPLVDSSGRPNDRFDHRVLLSVGWNF